MICLVLTACGGFLLAVLWMDLMFDVQVLRYPGVREVPIEVLTSISAYYRRVTTEARPMGQAVGLVMAATILTVFVELVRGREPLWLGVSSLGLCGVPICLAALRVLPNAVRLGARLDSPAEQTRLARAICRDHLVCFGAIASFLAVQLLAAAQ